MKWKTIFLEKSKKYKLMSRKHKMVCTTLSNIELFFILGSTITGRVFNSAFASVVGTFIGSTSSAMGFKTLQ